MVTKVAFGLAIVLAAVSGSLAASYGSSARFSAPPASPFTASEPTIWGWPVHHSQEQGNRK